MTFKQFKELADVHVYGKGKDRRVRLFYDWKQDFSKGNIIGYKYEVKGYGVTKERILRDGYDILIAGLTDALCWYDLRVAETDEKRFKVPICG